MWKDTPVVPGQSSWSSKGQSHWSSSRSLTDHWPASNRPFSRSTAQTAAGVIEKTKWRPCNHRNVVMRSFFTLITNYAQIKRLKYWVFGIGNFEISRWNPNFICLYPSHIHFLSALSKHRPNLPVGKVYTKIYVKISIKYSIVISAAEPTSLPFLGSRRLPWNSLCQRATQLILKRAKPLIL